MVQFVWSGNLHNVGVAVDGDCENIVNTTEPATQGNVTFTLNNELAPIQSNGEIYMACSGAPSVGG